jgi:hypothetical protein
MYAGWWLILLKSGGGWKLEKLEKLEKRRLAEGQNLARKASRFSSVRG